MMIYKQKRANDKNQPAKHLGDANSLSKPGLENIQTVCAQAFNQHSAKAVPCENHQENLPIVLLVGFFLHKAIEQVNQYHMLSPYR